MRLYIAGPMSGLPDYNYPAFHAAESELRAAGHDVLNPATNPAPCMNPTWEDWMRTAIRQVIQADAVAFLPGSHNSRGARLELTIADSLGMDTRPLREWITS